MGDGKTPPAAAPAAALRAARALSPSDDFILRSTRSDTRDVADVARIALLEEIEPASQRAYHLSGLRAWTMKQVAEKLARLLGHSVTYVDRSPAEQREALLSAGFSPLVAELLVGLDQMFRESTIAETTSTVEELTGNAPVR